MEKDSNKRFGISLSLILGLISIGFENPLRTYTLLFALALLAASIFAPTKLNFLRLVWKNISRVLEMTIGRLILATFYYVVVTPTALILRMTTRDSLGLKSSFRNKESYWHDLEPADDKDAFLQF